MTIAAANIATRAKSLIHRGLRSCVLIMIVMRMAACSSDLVEHGEALHRTSRHDAVPQRLEFIEPAMGMQARIVLYADDAVRAKAAADAAFAEIARLDAILSDWRDDTQLAKVNLEAGGMPVQVDSSFIDVLERAAAISKASDGAFDVTIGPVTQMWREARKSGREPSQAEVDAAHALVDWRLVEIDVEYRTLRLPRAGMRLDVGGIGKGYAADRALATLRERGYRACMVSLAGDIAIGDAPPGERGWKIAVADGLSDSAAQSSLTLCLHNCGVSTSGDAEQFTELGGERRSHIVDPKNGLGLRERIAVTVVARDATESDSLATAASVLGAAKAIEMLTHIEGAAARIVTLDHDRPRVETTASFAALVADG